MLSRFREPAEQVRELIDRAAGETERLLERLGAESEGTVEGAGG